MNPDTHSSGDRLLVNIAGISKSFRSRHGEVRALSDVSVQVGAGEFVVLLGPSGCGKTTLLRSVAGLERPDDGRIEIGGRTVFDGAGRVSLPPEHRQLSMVFQSYALWPHMSVFENVAYPLRNRRRPDIKTQVMRTLEMVQCHDLAMRYPGQLSGGQQQRVALARALVAGDQLVLFDEPLSNVDAKVREVVRFELLNLQRELGFSTLYVTHDQSEATALAHKIVVMKLGGVAQIGTPRDVYERPNSRYVAAFLGATNFVEATVDRIEGDKVLLTTALGPLVANTEAAAMPLQPGGKILAVLRPEKLRVSANAPPATLNVFNGTLRRSLYLGAFSEQAVMVGDKQLFVQSTQSHLGEQGDTVHVSIDKADVRLVAQEAE